VAVRLKLYASDCLITIGATWYSLRGESPGLGFLYIATDSGIDTAI
jgi:hypothetical protein